MVSAICQQLVVSRGLCTSSDVGPEVLSRWKLLVSIWVERPVCELLRRISDSGSVIADRLRCCTSSVVRGSRQSSVRVDVFVGVMSRLHRGCRAEVVAGRLLSIHTGHQ